MDSYGGSPPCYSDTYYLCPNTTYTICYNNYENDCQTSNFVWTLPYGWTKYWEYENCVGINTNSYPEGMINFTANSCCSTNSILKTVYFGEAECGGYFMAYPNPANDLVNIDIIKEKFSAEDLKAETDCTVSIIDKSGTTKYKTEFKGFPYRIDTSNLPNGIYFININYQDKKSTIRLVVER